MIQEIRNKFKKLKTWQKILVVLVGVILLPLAILIAVALLSKGRGSDEITETLVDQKKKDIKERLKEADKKDKILVGKEEAFQVEKKILQKEIEKNGSDHAEISNRIDNAKSIDELRAIARKLRKPRP